MKVVFAGPSLHGSHRAVPADIALLEPARQGDVHRAVNEGTNVIGLVDGYFDDSAAVWHKEILFALSEGVTVFGASSMGALRAVECCSFGMIGVGKIFEAYRRGEIIDDGAVALSHGPRETGYLPLTVAYVDVIATVRSLETQEQITSAEVAALLGAAETIFFKDRTWRAIVSAIQTDPARSDFVLQSLRTGFVSQKQIDAELLLDRVSRARDERSANRPGWTLQTTTYLAL
ncbi:TfuA-like protein [Ciceribacter sp. L1K23]|uniref:TfuA-like protein n=1 Tax=Ciceribacter sp. L1K23 TaxID=2820276 RepID=UPI001B842B21|nr:TfuA-like protein [Ciceribacter sp. L1K23]